MPRAPPGLPEPGAHHGDALRVQKRAQRARLGAPLAAVRGVQGGGGHLGAQLDRHLSVLASARHSEARSLEDAQHPVVVREHLGLESGDPVLAAQCREVFQEKAAEPPAPVLVGHQEGDLRAFMRQQLGGRQCCDAPAKHGNQRDRRVVGLVEQSRDVRPSGGRARREEAKPECVLRDALVQRQHPLAVAGDERADDGDRAVGQEDVGCS